MRDAIEWIQARKEGHVANMVGAVVMDVKEAKKEADQEGEKEEGATQSEVAPVVGSGGSKGLTQGRPRSLQRDVTMSMNVTVTADTTDDPTAPTAPTAPASVNGGGVEGGEGTVGGEALGCTSNEEEGGDLSISIPIVFTQLGGEVGGGEPLSSDELVKMTETWEEVRSKLRDAYGTAYSKLVPMCIDSCEVDFTVF